MPMKTTRPPGQSGSKMPAAAARVAASIRTTTSAPQPSVASRTVSARSCERTLTGVIGPEPGGEGELGLVDVA